ncbi:MAG: dTMP kinase, partial [Ignavibacterium sp.]|nr:dTMP kinase [Ignavibacterium sp.]
ISDRFHDSSTAYQGFGRGLPIDSVLSVHKLAIGNTIPDLTFFIDIPVSVAIKRKAEKTHQELDRIEVSSNDFFEKVRNGYLSIAKEEKRFRIIDGTKSIEEIHNIIINYIEEFEQR